MGLLEGTNAHSHVARLKLLIPICVLTGNIIRRLYASDATQICQLERKLVLLLLPVSLQQRILDIVPIPEVL